MVLSPAVGFQAAGELPFQGNRHRSGPEVPPVNTDPKPSAGRLEDSFSALAKALRQKQPRQALRKEAMN